MKCDYCVAMGLVEVEHIRDKTTLLFCGHHMDVFDVALMVQGFQIIRDERDV